MHRQNAVGGNTLLLLCSHLMRKKPIYLPAFLLISLLSATVCIGQVDYSKDFMTTSKGVIGLLPPDFICGPVVSKVLWSPDDNFLAVERIKPSPNNSLNKSLTAGISEAPTEGEILTWNTRTQAAKSVFSFDSTLNKVQTIQWLSNSSSLVVSITQTKNQSKTQEILLISPTSGKITKLYSQQDKPPVSVSVSSVNPIGVLSRLNQTDSGQEFLMVVFGQNGEQGRVAAMPTIANASMLLAGFDAQGNGPFASFITANQSGGIVKTETFQFNNESGQLVKQTQPVNLFFGSIPDKLAPLRVSTEPIPGLSSAMGKTMMWLDFPKEKSKARILVTTDGQTPMLAPHQTALAYKHLGGLVVRRIASISPGFYQRMVSKEHKENAEHICQSIATALKQLKSSGFAGLPTAMQWEEYATRVNMAPMLREAFSYQYAGEPISDIDLAARQIVGIVSTPSGRAVLYADMHIVWEPSH